MSLKDGGASAREPFTRQQDKAGLATESPSATYTSRRGGVPSSRVYEQASLRAERAPTGTQKNLVRILTVCWEGWPILPNARGCWEGGVASGIPASGRRASCPADVSHEKLQGHHLPPRDAVKKGRRGHGARIGHSPGGCGDSGCLMAGTCRGSEDSDR